MTSCWKFAVDNLKHWRGLQSKNMPQAAPMLVFGYFALG